MRTLTSIAVVASTALVLGAGQAAAVSSIDLVYLGGASGGLSGADTVSTADSDTIRFAIVYTADSLPFTNWAFDLRWDSDGENELDLVNHRERLSLSLVVDPGPPPTTLSYSIAPLSLTQESTTAGLEGRLYGYDGASVTVSPPFPSSLSFRVGIVEFHVNNPNNSAGPDIKIGYYRPPCDICPPDPPPEPNYGSFQVDDIPEPGNSLLVGMGVLSLILVSRATRKS